MLASGAVTRETKSSLDSAPDRDDLPMYGNESSSGRPPRPRAAVPDQPPFQAYVGNLSYEVKEEDLSEFFKGLGVKSIKIIQDFVEKRSKGYGYVEFEDRESLVQALALARTVSRKEEEELEIFLHLNDCRIYWEDQLILTLQRVPPDLHHLLVWQIADQLLVVHLLTDAFEKKDPSWIGHPLEAKNPERLSQEDLH